VSTQLPAPHGALAQPSMSRQCPLPSSSKPVAQVVHASSDLLVQLTTLHEGIASQAAQVLPSSKWPTGQVQTWTPTPPSLHVPTPHGLPAQSSTSWQPAPAFSKPGAQALQLSSLASLQTTVAQFAIGSHA